MELYTSCASTTCAACIVRPAGPRYVFATHYPLNSHSPPPTGSTEDGNGHILERLGSPRSPWNLARLVRTRLHRRHNVLRLALGRLRRNAHLPLPTRGTWPAYRHHLPVRPGPRILRARHPHVSELRRGRTQSTRRAETGRRDS